MTWQNGSETTLSIGALLHIDREEAMVALHDLQRAVDR
jgi:hypothetical protein